MIVFIYIWLKKCRFPQGCRVPGYVGTPLPSVEVAICAPPDDEQQTEEGGGGEGAVGEAVAEEETAVVAAAHRPVAAGESGELRVKGPGVFKEYLNRPEATAEAFDEAGWFMTGDFF